LDVRELSAVTSIPGAPSTRAVANRGALFQFPVERLPAALGAESSLLGASGEIRITKIRFVG
jgi:hypothetical protein